MSKSTAKTTITFRGVTYPFYRTVRGKFDFENAGYTDEQMAAGKVPAMYAYIFFQLRDCAKRAGTPLTISFDDFIDQADGEDLLSVYGRMFEEQKKKQGEVMPGKTDPEVQEPKVQGEG